MKAPRVTLEQWRTLQAIVDSGGYAQAAEHLHRSQSSISYAMQRLESHLGIKILKLNGRKAELTEAGARILHQARGLLKDASDLEFLAENMRADREAEIRLVVDAAFPFILLIRSLREFQPVSLGTQIQLEQVIMTGAEEKLVTGEADLAISFQVPGDMLGEELIHIEFIAAAHPDHPLHQLDEEITADHLRRHMQVVISDSGIQKNQNLGWLGANEQWFVSSMESALQLLQNGMGYAWLPRHILADSVQAGTLKFLPLHTGRSYHVSLYLIFAAHDPIGPATEQLAGIIRHCVQGYAYE